MEKKLLLNNNNLSYNKNRTWRMFHNITTNRANNKPNFYFLINK